MKSQRQDCQRPDCQTTERKQLIITLNLPESAIIRIEALDDSGARYDVPAGEFSTLIGDYEMEDLHPLPQPAFGPEFYAADGYFELDDCESELDDDPEPVAGCMAESRRLILQEAGMRALDRLLKQRFREFQDRSLAYWEVVLSLRMRLN
jgi:hypothetical protein